jgi:hypothetical protein
VREHAIPRVLLGGLLLAALPAIAQVPSAPVHAYRAVYSLWDGDRKVGRSEFRVERDRAGQRYRFTSSSEFDGLLRWLTPRPVIETSEFIVDGGEIKPLSFSYEDGSRRGRRNLEVEFDWGAAVAVITHAGGSSRAPLPAGTLDRGSVRVALMRDLARQRRDGRYRLADPDVIREYTYVTAGRESLTTPLGELAAVKVVQQREDSSRRTVFWAAPQLHYLPIRIEQLRDDRAPVAFALESVEWLDTP